MFGGPIDSFFKESVEVLILETVSRWVLSLDTLNKIVVVSGVLEEYSQTM